MTIPERLVAIREANGYTRKRLAEELGKPYRTITNYENGEREPGHLYIVEIAKKFGVTTDYILGNTDIPYKKEEEKKDSIDGKITDHNLFTPQEQSIIKKYRVLDEHGKEVVSIILDKEYERYKKLQKAVTISSSVPTTKGNTAPLQEQKIIYLPEPLQAASAGTGQIADDDTAEQVAVYYNEVTSKADFIMRVSGNSMEPKFMDGDRVLVRRQPAVEIGETGIFIREGERYIKIYRGSYLESINPEYGNVSLEEYSRCLGKVIGILKPDWIAE